MPQFPTYVPAYRVLINDEPLPGVLQASISSLTYQDGIEGADRVEVTFANPNLQWLDHPVLQVDNGFKLSIGYAPDPLQEVFVGEITGVEPSFPNSGMPTLKVVAHDFLQRLTHAKSDRAFLIKITSTNNFPIPDVVIASLVSATNLLIPYPDPVGGTLSLLLGLAAYVVTPTEAQRGIRYQVNTSDFDFLSRISKANGWDMSIDHEAEPRGYILRFRSLFQDYSPSLTLKYGQSLMDFTPKITTVGDVFGVSARIWVASIKMEFVIVVGWNFDESSFNLRVYPGIGQLKSILSEKEVGRTVNIKPVGFAQAPLKLLGELLPRLNNRVTGSGSSIGDPRIKSGHVIRFEGIGDQFGGLYRITSATHSFGSGGYKTNFQARKEVWFGSLPKPKSVAGLFRVQGQRLG